MAGIKVSGQELRNRATQMRNRVNNMSDALKRVTDAVSRSEEAFQSEAGNTFRSQYGELKSKFDSFKNATISYADFLDKTAQTYDEANKDLENKAKGLQV